MIATATGGERLSVRTYGNELTGPPVAEEAPSTTLIGIGDEVMVGDRGTW
jgi:hypothetical protein